MLERTMLPLPGSLRTTRCPPAASARSRMPTTPKCPRSSALRNVHEGRASVAGRLRELGPEERGVFVERALTALEREHHTGELLRETIVQLLRDLPPLGRHALVDDVGRRRSLQQSHQVLADAEAEVSVVFG